MNRDDVKNLCLRYLDGDLDPAQAKAFDRLIADSPEAAQLLARLSFFDSCYETTAVLADDYDDGAAIDRLIEQARLDQAHPARKPALKDAAGLLGYILLEAAKTKPARVLATAAALALAAVIAIVLLTPADQPAPSPIAQTPTPKPATSAQPTPRDSAPGPLGSALTQPVATITATHNAVWAEGASAPGLGSELKAGARLTLTAGFAEITTNRGAVAILEAPATIELIDSDNAIRLHAGKLVGICETESSKGFVVRTPHMDITDLGTRFGVDAGTSTQVYVMDGEVAVDVGRGDAPVTLIAGLSALADVDTQHVAVIRGAQGAFVGDWKAAVNPPKLTGEIRYEPAMPSDLRMNASEDPAVRLFHERSGVTLHRAVNLNVTQPGQYAAGSLPDPQPIRDQTVDSYLVHLDIPDSGGLTKHRVTITFDRPILGVITASEQLAQSHAVLGLPGVQYGNRSDWAGVEWGLDSSGLDTSVKKSQYTDRFQLSEDRRTIELHLTTATAIDQARVIVQSEVTTE